MSKKLRKTLPAAAAMVAFLGLSGCGGGSSSGGSAAPADPLGIKYGGHALAIAQHPTKDLTLAQASTLPVGTVVAVALDRNNPTSAYYTATVMGYDSLDQLVWLRLTSDVATPSGEGDSGTAVFTLPNTFTAASGNAAYNGSLIGALSYGASDNQVDFLATPIALMRATGGAVAKSAVPSSSAISFSGKKFKRLSSPVFYAGMPKVVVDHMKAHAPKSAVIQSLQPVPTAETASARRSAFSRSIDGTDPFGNSTVATFLAHGDVFFSGAVGSVTATDGDGWLGYGHPLQGAGGVGLATCSATVVNMFPEPVDGTYKLANPTNTFDKTMTWDGINAVRITKSVPQEVTVITDLVNGNSKKTFTHYVGYDGVLGDQATYLDAAIETAYLSMYDQEVDLQGFAIFHVTTVINGVSSTSQFDVPADADGIFFGYNPNDPNLSTLDGDLYTAMEAVEFSGDRKATVHVTASIVIQPPVPPPTTGGGTGITLGHRG